MDRERTRGGTGDRGMESQRWWTGIIGAVRDVPDMLETSEDDDGD